MTDDPFRELGRWHILDADNNIIECTMLTWARWIEEDTGRRTVGWTQITSEVTVSTVFLGMDHRLWGKGPPLLFETMIFGGPLDEHMWRYSSYDDAQTGHAAAVRKAREAIGQKITEE
jgi:hypothetical protein